MLNSKLYLKTIFIVGILGVVLGGCGKSSSVGSVKNEEISDKKEVVDNPSVDMVDDFINEKTYLEIAKFNYMNENMHVLLHKKSSKNSKSLPGGKKNKLYPGDIQRVIKQDNLFEVSSELIDGDFINKLSIANKSSRISVDVDRDKDLVVVNLFRDEQLIKSRELSFELFADSAADRYYEEN